MSCESADVQRQITALLREAQDRNLRTAAEGLLVVFRIECQQALDWQCRAGRALAVEGWDTSVLRDGVEAWIDRARLSLRDGLVALLGRTR